NRLVGLARQGEGCTVLEHAAAACQGELAGAEQVAVDRRLRQAPAMRTQRGGAVAHQGFEPAVLLLEVLRPQEHSFQPDDAVGPGHADSSTALLRLTVSASLVSPIAAIGAMARH